MIWRFQIVNVLSWAHISGSIWNREGVGVGWGPKLRRVVGDVTLIAEGNQKSHQSLDKVNLCILCQEIPVLILMSRSTKRHNNFSTFY